ncbi:hypothetical protein BDK51DRAFT_41397 [Blyttiomyces helicus]|uniref:Probable lysosomal cobalamin transporter n=1 Tax=Blyttiomyces helicus TaxID=388810 RepID=A0A4P9W6G7_9FUNG|nr:hypothetical protein BDK51DRAFT_41397 [Blyttiomyces helicus]|eukprot:RKO88051.1 hypothetical protein BDK51DRAFT_41397 [Blyttiomyces helicus]
MLGETLLAIFLVSTCVASAWTHRYYDRDDKEGIVCWVTVLSLGEMGLRQRSSSESGSALSLCVVSLVPIDVFLTAGTNDPSTGLKYPWATPDVVAETIASLKWAYIGFYCALFVVCFACIPWVYFYFEEGGDEDEEEGSRFGRRARAATKYASFTVLILATLLCIGFFLKYKPSGSDDPDWYKKLLTADGAERAVTFTIAAITTLGMLVYLSYTALGLAFLPIGLMKDILTHFPPLLRLPPHTTGRKFMDINTQDVSEGLEIVHEQLCTIEARYVNEPLRPMTPRDKRERDRLRDRQRDLERQAWLAARAPSGWRRAALRFMRPIQVGFNTHKCLPSKNRILRRNNERSEVIQRQDRQNHDNRTKQQSLRDRCVSLDREDAKPKDSDSCRHESRRGAKEDVEDECREEDVVKGEVLGAGTTV